MDIEYDIDAYAFFGLNKYRSWLEAGIKVEGYNYKMALLQVLASTDCNNPAVFLIGKDKLYVAHYAQSPDGRILRRIVQAELSEYQMFAVVDAGERFCCYVLLIETEGGMFVTL